MARHCPKVSPSSIQTIAEQHADMLVSLIVKQLSRDGVKLSGDICTIAFHDEGRTNVPGPSRKGEVSGAKSVTIEGYPFQHTGGRVPHIAYAHNVRVRPCLGLPSCLFCTSPAKPNAHVLHRPLEGYIHQENTQTPTQCRCPTASGWPEC